MLTKKIKVDYTSTTNFAHPVAADSEKLFDIVKRFSCVSSQKWKTANDILILEMSHKMKLASYPDLNDIAFMLFEAGRIYGMREERARKLK